ncbi:MAG: hypothetical protein R2762_18745 [Bryobacteraceae bacterium]
MTSAGSSPTPYHKAAAVLVSFNPDTIVPLGEATDSDFEQLLADSTVDAGRSGPEWSLNNEARRASLEALGSPGEMQRALAANPQPATPAQKCYRRMSTVLPPQ